MESNSQIRFKEKVHSFFKKVKNDDRTKKGLRYVWQYRQQCFLGFLVFFGILLSFFFIHLGGGLIGISAGLCFHKEIRQVFLGLRAYCQASGIFKTALLITLGIYLFLALPAFLFSLLIGFGAATFAINLAS